jgi:hypothetical protein
MRTQDAVELRAEALDRAPTLRVQAMRTQLHRDAAQRIERMREQQAFCFRVEGRPLHAARIPGGSDLDATMDVVDVHVGRHADDAAVGCNHSEGQHQGLCMQVESAFDLLHHALRRGYARVPKPPELTVAHGIAKR